MSAGVISPPLVVGYSAKEQKNTKPTGIITFQWDSVNGETMKLNGFIAPSNSGAAFDHGNLEDCTPGWYLTAPKIQIRRPDGGYTVRYYADDGWDNDNNDTRAGWCIEDGSLDTTTTVDVGGGFWLNQPNGDQKIYVTVKNPVK